MAVEMKDCAQMLKRMQELGFVAVELNLYLDTHPNDAKALEQYNLIHHEIRQLQMKMDEQCGPSKGFGHSMNVGNTWQWAEQPWPWEM